MVSLCRYLSEPSMLQSVLPSQPLLKHLGFLLFLLLLLAFGFFPDAGLEQLEYRYSEPFSSRWLTAHFIHLTPTHMVMNVAGAAVLWALVVAYVPSFILVISLLVLPFVVSAGLQYSDLTSGLVSYRGFSGILYGFYLLGVFFAFWKERWIAATLLLFLLVKIFLEQLPSFDPEYMRDNIGGVVAVDAHLFGFLGGAMIIGLYYFGALLQLPGCILPWQRWKKKLED